MHQHAGSCALFLHGKTKCCMLHPVSDNITLGYLSGNSNDEHNISKNSKRPTFTQHQNERRPGAICNTVSGLRGLRH